MITENEENDNSSCHWEKELGAEVSSEEAEVRHQNAYILASSCKWQLAAWPWPGGQSALLVEFGIQDRQLQSGNSPAAL